MDRINAYFGYRAVETLRLVQVPVSAPAPERRAPPQSQRAGELPVKAASGQANGLPASEAEDALAAALARMERGVLAGRPARTR